jgi:hypothetical protein
MQWKVNARDTRFVPKVRPTIKVTYVSVEELIKNRVSFNPNPPKLPPRPIRCSLSIPTKRRTIQTFWDFTTILESSRTTTNHLEDWTPQRNKHNEVVEEEGEVLLLEGWHTQGSSNLLSRIRIKIWMLGREERAQALDLKEAFWFFEWPTTLWGRWGSIYSHHLKNSHWGAFHRTSLVDLSESRCRASGSRSYTGQAQLTGLVWWHHRTSPVGASESRWGLSRSWSGTRQVQWEPLEAGHWPD